MSDGYTPSIYEQNEVVAGFRGTPRFGHSDDVSKIFSTESSDHIDYTFGTIFISAFLLVAFILWFLILIIFACVGKERVGFLSGFPIVKKTIVKSNIRGGVEGAKQGNGGAYPKVNNENCCCETSTHVRIIFVFSCLVVITLSALSAFFFGFSDLKIATDEISANALEIRNVALDGESTVSSLETYGEYSSTLRQIILPDLTYESFCLNTALDEATGLPFNVTRQKVVDDLVALGNFNIESFNAIREDLFEEMKTRAGNTFSFFATYGIHHWQLLTYVISYSTLASFMMITTICSWTGNPLTFFICTSTWFLLPFLIVMVTLSMVLASFIGVAAVMNADFCTGGSMLEGPDLTTMNILEQSNLEDQSKLLYDASSYWFNGCKSDSPFSYIDNYMNLLNASMTSMNEFESMIADATTTQLEQICGIVGDFDSVEIYLDRLQENFDEISSSAAKTADMLSCESINSIYTDAVHDSACTDFPHAILWAFVSLSIVSFFGMVMITLRSAWLEVKEKKVKMTDEMPIISIEKIRDLDDEHFNDSPSPKYREYDATHRQEDNGGFTETTELNPETETQNSRFTETDHSKMTETDASDDVPEQSPHDPVAMYQSISVAVDGLTQIPSSPKDPPGYRVY